MAEVKTDTNRESRAADFDYVIVGAGASGLLLCAELLSRPELRNKRIAVVDDGSFASQNRAWGYWSQEHGPVDDLAEREWTVLDVFADDENRRLDLTPYRYRYVRGAAIDEWVRAESHAGHVAWIVDRIEAVRATSDGVIATGRAGEYRASLMFDSRPPHDGPESRVKLYFVGWEIETPAPEFTPDIATFMDFRLCADERVQFGYVLPLSQTRALIELASFSHLPWDREEAEGALRQYLSHVQGVSDWKVLRSECGELPLILDPDGGETDPIIPIGRRGGLLRASTGYGFDRMRRHAIQIADALTAGSTAGRDLRFKQNKRHAYLDRVLLDVVTNEPNAIESAFAALFARNPPDRILRFLDGDSSRIEEAKIVASMPKAPFLRAARRVR